jgi:stalled ribosome alternative rescue factor ArfA
MVMLYISSALFRQQEEKKEEGKAGGRKQKLVSLIPEQWYHNEGT